MDVYQSYSSLICEKTPYKPHYGASKMEASMSKQKRKLKIKQGIKKKSENHHQKETTQTTTMDAHKYNGKNEHDIQSVNAEKMTTLETPPTALKRQIFNGLSSYIEEPWDIINTYFKDNHFKMMVRNQLESFDDFVNLQIHKTLDMFNPVIITSPEDYVPEHNLYKINIEITFKNLILTRPSINENNGATKLMFPNEARLRNFTYNSNINVDFHIKYTYYQGEEFSHKKTKDVVLRGIKIGSIPIMLKSSVCLLTQFSNLTHAQTDECFMDPGGYFIVNGSEKTVIGQERAAENKIYCFDLSKNNSKWQTLCEVNSSPDYKEISPKKVSILIASRGSEGYNTNGSPIYIQLKRLKQPIPVAILYRALGIISDKDICKHILLNIKDAKNKKLLLFLKASLVEANTIMTQEDAINYIVSMVSYTPMKTNSEQGKTKKREYAEDVIETDLFPHCRTKSQRIYLLGYAIFRAIKVNMGIEPEDDRDSYLNKRVDSVGVLLNNLFRNYFNKMVKDMIKKIQYEITRGSWKSTNQIDSIINKTNIYKLIKISTIENGIKRALSTGDFGIKQTNQNKVGVAQVLNRLTYVSAISHLRRVNTPIDKSGKLIQPRKLHNTSWGFLCPAETPEGHSVGVVKNLGYLTHLTIYSDAQPIYRVLDGHYDAFGDIGSCDPLEYYNKVKVIVNGTWLGVTEDPITLFNYMKQQKYTGKINVYTSVVFDASKMEINICNDAGRVTRPLLIAKDKRLILNDAIIKRVRNNELKWDDLCLSTKLDHPIIEYVDPSEQNSSLIAMTPRDVMNNYELVINPDKTTDGDIYSYTHCEIHPSSILGILASCIPFPDHNQSPRNTYQCAMGKQAMGVYVTNYDKRMDRTAYVMSYPMRPLVDTRIMNMIHLNNIPSGAPVVVAIMCHSGFNQEDSILFNQGSIDRGLFQATIYHTEVDEDKNNYGNNEIRCKPDASKTRGMKFANYDKLNHNGVIPENTIVEDRDIIISKVIPIKDARNDNTKVIKYDDYSKSYRTNEACYIDKNVIDRNEQGYKFCKVRIRTLRKPIIGDKFSSRHGQKGTIGNIIPEENMPFTSDGIKPDIIINPHAIPSRMTIAHLKETLLGKVLLELGLFGDGTSFGDMDIDFIRNQLLKCGYESHGEELLYNGLDGTQIETSIFVGPCFYQRLKHMVSDKQHSRSIGPMVNLTRQPAEGRSRDGGLRFGEMERDCMISHGAARFTRGRMYDASDKFEVYVCNDCGLIAAFNEKEGVHLCKVCENRTSFSRVEIPYSCKLMFQELTTMNIAPRMITEQITENVK
jgi:DNA-directed RNA polymerase II subunit RPB2